MGILSKNNFVCWGSGLKVPTEWTNVFVGPLMLCKWRWTSWLWWWTKRVRCPQACHPLFEVLDKWSSFSPRLLQPLVCYITMWPSIVSISFDMLIFVANDSNNLYHGQFPPGGSPSPKQLTDLRQKQNMFYDFISWFIQFTAVSAFYYSVMLIFAGLCVQFNKLTSYGAEKTNRPPDQRWQSWREIRPNDTFQTAITYKWADVELLKL